jgi:hypothetical protein
VRNTGVGDECNIESWVLVLDELLQLCDFPDLLVCEDLTLLVSINYHSSGIITAIFETRETCKGRGRVS